MNNLVYNYAGFDFIINEKEEKAIAMPFQHRAAYKDKHAIAAWECYCEEKKIAS